MFSAMRPTRRPPEQRYMTIGFGNRVGEREDATNQHNVLLSPESSQK